MTRPVNLDLASLRYPPMAIASILHRISGILLFLLLPFVLCAFHQSLHSDQSFNAFKESLGNPYWMFITWVFLSALLYHCLAGVRHVLMDLGLGETLPLARHTAILVIALSVVLSVLLGVWLW